MESSYATPREYLLIFLLIFFLASSLGAAWWVAALAGAACSLGSLGIDWIYDQRR